jgi:hypothetical protein
MLDSDGFFAQVSRHIRSPLVFPTPLLALRIRRRGDGERADPAHRLVSDRCLYRHHLLQRALSECPWTAPSRMSLRRSTCACSEVGCCGATPTARGVRVPGLTLVMQRVLDYRPPCWPGESIVHIDLTAGE